MRAVLRRRLLLYFSVLAALILLILGGASYRLALRALPQTSGTVRLAIRHQATITRDALGVPHIQAGNIEDALFLQGYATAQDRLWQMDAIRRLAGGELSEVIGPATLELDRDARQLRLRRIAELHAQHLYPDDRAALAAYTRGVNAFLDTHRNRLPLEFSLLGYQPRHWTMVDSVLVGLAMFRDMTTTWKDDVRKRDLLAAGDVEKVRQLFPARSGKGIQVGSNAWAISGKHTASGKPLLANDPHLQWTMPSSWYMVHLTAPGLDVTGVSLPGLPAVIIGHNQRIAWGCTNLHYDVQDLYLEQIDHTTGQTLFRDEREQARQERETIVVKGKPPVEYATWVTRHGPLLDGGRSNLALRWVAAEPEMFQFPFLQIDQARNWTDFTVALSRFAGPGQNFVYADVDGHIGYHATGKLPIRKAYVGDVPVDGSSGEFEWEGYIPFEQLPQAYDPPDGYIVTANQNPFPVMYAYNVNGNFAPVYRARQIRDRLNARGNWRAAEMIALQKDVYAGFAQQLARETVTAYDRKRPADEPRRTAVELLRHWDGQMDRDSAPALVASLLLEELRSRLAERAAHSKGTAYETSAAIPAVEWLLSSRPAGWFSDYDQLLMDALADAMRTGASQFGSHVRHWQYGRSLELTLTNPVAGRIPLIGSFFNIGPAPMSGSSLTVKQTSRRLGPSMRFVADLADWNESLLNVTTGESGQPFSRHYRDQWEAYYNGYGLPRPFTNAAASETVTVVP